MNVVFATRMLDLGHSRCVAAETVMPCGCQLRDAEQFPTEPKADWPKNDSKAKATLVLRLQKAARDHDHRAHVIKLVTTRLKQ